MLYVFDIRYVYNIYIPTFKTGTIYYIKRAAFPHHHDSQVYYNIKNNDHSVFIYSFPGWIFFYSYNCVKFLKIIERMSYPATGF